jgi:putative PEP-CTERM system TPR-repeat lipoprotein
MKISNKLTLAVGVAIFLSACTPDMTTNESLAQAKVFSEKHDNNSAIIVLKNAVRIEPKNSNVRFELGSAYFAQGDYLRAEKQLEEAEKLGSDNKFLITYLVQIKVKLNKFDYVYQIAEQSGTYPEATQVIVLTYAGISAIHQNKPEQAKKYIERAISISDDSIYGNIGKVYLSHSGSNYQNGLTSVDELLVSSPNFAEAILLKGYLLQALEKFDIAAKTFEKYAKLRPKDIQVKFFIAQNYVYAENFKAAEPYVDFLLKISENHPLANQLKAEIEYSKENFKVAMDHAITSFQQDSSFHLAKIVAGISAYKLGDIEQAYQYLFSIKDLLSPEHLIRKLIIDLQLKLGYDIEAVAGLQLLVDLNAVDSSMLTMASNQMITSGNIKAAQELLQSSIAIDTSTPIELAKQAIIQLRLNQAEQGIARLEQALKLDPELAFAEQGLAVGYLAKKQFAKALIIAKKWQANDAKKVQGYLLESAILGKQEKETAAQVLLNKVLILDGNNVAALFKLAIYAHKNGNTQQAFDYYTQVLILQPQHIRTIINFNRLITSTVKNGDEFTNRAIDFYKKQLALQPKNNSTKLGLASIFKIAKRFEAAIKLLQEIANSKTPLKGIEIALGDSYKNQGNWTAAITEYQKFVDANPKNLAIAHKLFTLFEQTNQLEKAITQIDKTLVEYQDNAGLLLLKSFYQSKLKMMQSQSDLAKIKANEATKNHWLLDKTLGNFAYNRKDFKISAKFYRDAYAKKSNDDNVINWSKSTHLRGDKRAALTILERHIKNLGDDNVANIVKIMLGGAYLKSGEQLKAKEIYKSIIKTEPTSIIALNNLSYIELQQKNIQQSLNYAEQAVSLTKNNAIIIDTYAQALVANKQLELAIEQYDKAIALDVNNTEFRIHMAEALIIDQQTNVAKSLLISVKTNNKQEQARIKLLLNKL